MMTKTKSIVLAIGTGLILTGCAGPEIVDANQRAITVSYRQEDARQAASMAEAHCHKYGKVAVRTVAESRAYKTETFECK